MINKYIFIIITFFLSNCQFHNNKYKEYKGFIYGTYFRIKYLSQYNYISDINKIFHNIDNSLSNYSNNSILYKINYTNCQIDVNDHFQKVFFKSKEIFKITNGAFDPTLNNYKSISNQIQHNSVNKYIGFNKIFLIKKRIFKPKGFFLDFNAITKGYVVDLICEFFNKKKIFNYIVEIGGEIRVKGKNQNHKLWQIGIEKPIINQKLGAKIIKILTLNNQAIATSGCYRNFIKYPGSKKNYSHIINYKTGLPLQNTKLVSVSIIAKDCITADAYATAFMILGIDNAKKILQKYKNIQLHALFITKNNNIFKYIYI